MRKGVSPESSAVRDKILATASELFYNHGIRAVGVDTVVEKAQVAKTSLYRHFGNKDELVVAFLQQKDENFWRDWDRVSAAHADDPRAELFAQLEWIGDRAGRPEYRGCPQINIVAEYPELDHPARQLARAHKARLRERLRVIAERLGCARPDELAGQLGVLLNGAFVSSSMFEGPEEARHLLRTAVSALLAAGKPF